MALALFGSGEFNEDEFNEGEALPGGPPTSGPQQARRGLERALMENSQTPVSERAPSLRESLMALRAMRAGRAQGRLPRGFAAARPLSRLAGRATPVTV